MRTLLKIIGVLLLVVVLLIALVLVLPDKQYQVIAEKLIKNATDRDVTIGELTTIRNLNPSVEIKNFSISNASWARQPEMISASNLYLSMNLAQLFEGKLHINDLSAQDLNIDLVKNETGDANWHFKAQPPDSDKTFNEQILTHIILSQFNLDNAKLGYLDEKEKLKYRIELPTLALITDSESEDIQHVSVEGLFNDLPFSIKGDAGLIDSLAKNKFLPFDFHTTLNESSIAVKGQIEQLPESMPLTTTVYSHTASLSDLSVFTVNELPPIGPITISADIAADLKALTSKGVDIDGLDVKVDDPSIKLDLNGSLAGIGATNTGDITLNLDVSELPKLTKLFGLKKELPGTLSIIASAKGSGENFGLEISRATLDSKFLYVQLSGQVEDLMNRKGATIDINANAPDLEFITQLFGRNMPPQWGPITATATLTGQNNQYGLTDIVAELNGASTLKATGIIESLIGFNGMDLDVQASLATLSEISAFTPFPLPDLGPITADGKINWYEGKLSLNEAKANYNGVYGQADASGSIGDLIKFDIVRLKADATIPDLDVAELFSGVEMPDFKDIQASADLVSPAALDLSAKNLKASYDMDGIKVYASGSIDSMIKKRADLNLDVEGSLDSLASINSLFKISLPKIGPISATAKITGATKDIQLSELDILLSDSALHGSLKGDLGKLADFKGVDLDVNLSTPGVDLLFGRLNLQSNVKKSANLISHVNYEAGTFNFEKSELDIGGDKIIGELSLLNYLDKTLRPKITGKINVLNFNLRDLSGKNKNKPEQEQNGKFLSKTPLPYEFIESTDLDLEINIGRLRGNIFDFTNSTVVARSTDGLFRLGPFKGVLSEGNAVFQLDIDAKNRPTRTRLFVNIEGFNMAKASVFRDSKQIESKGDAVFKLNLDAMGRTPASIMASANGGGVLYVEDLLLKKGTLNLFTSNLIKTTFNAVNPFKKKKKDTEISCAAMAFKIDDGLMTTPFGVAAETTEYSVTGNGRVDFKTEAIDLEFNTKVKKILAINPFEKLTGLVKIVGELTDPDVTLNPKGILNIGATVGAAIATGGLSFWAQDQLEKMNAKSELCSKALGKAG